MPSAPDPRLNGYDALCERAAVGAAPPADFLDLVGPDARRFVNGYVTLDVRSLSDLQHARGFLTGREGKVIAELDLAALGDRLRLRLPAGSGEAVRAHLARYLLADRVELAPCAGLARLRLAGPSVPAVLGALGLEAPPAGAARPVVIAGAAGLLLGSDRGRRPRFELWAASGALDDLESALIEAGAERAAAAAFETRRVEEGELAFGIDYGPDNFPQESGDEAAVSYTKGCYLGQEVVARLRWRGRAQRLPFGLRFPERIPAPGTALLHEGRPAGQATSVAASPRHGAIGLALLHRRVGEPPARLELAGGGAAELATLPFDEPPQPRGGPAAG